MERMYKMITSTTEYPDITEVDPLFEMMVEALSNDGISENGINTCRHRLEAQARKYYDNLLNRIAAAYDDVNVIRVGLKAEEDSMARKVSEAYIATIKTAAEEARKKRTTTRYYYD